MPEQALQHTTVSSRSYKPVLRLSLAFLVAIVGLGGLLSRFLGSSGHSRGIDMAWRSSGATNAALVGNLLDNGLITTDRVKQAMLGV